MYYVRSFEQSFGARHFVVSESLESNEQWSQIIFLVALEFSRFIRFSQKKETSLNRFSATKYDAGNWILSKSWDFWGNLLGFFWEFFWNSFGNSWFFLSGIIWEFSMIVYIFKSQLIVQIVKISCYLNMEGIDFFVKRWFLLRFCLNARKDNNLDP